MQNNFPSRTERNRQRKLNHAMGRDTSATLNQAALAAMQIQQQ